MAQATQGPKKGQVLRRLVQAHAVWMRGPQVLRSAGATGWQAAKRAGQTGAPLMQCPRRVGWASDTKQPRSPPHLYIAKPASAIAQPAVIFSVNSRPSPSSTADSTSSPTILTWQQGSANKRMKWVRRRGKRGAKEGPRSRLRQPGEQLRGAAPTRAGCLGGNPGKRRPPAHLP